MGAEVKAKRWVTVRVEDTCDGLLIHEDDAKRHGLEGDRHYPGYFGKDGKYRIEIEASAPTDEDPTTPEAQAAYWKGAFERMAVELEQQRETAEVRLSLRDTFIAEKGLWSEFAETVLHQQSSLEASGE